MPTSTWVVLGMLTIMWTPPWASSSRATARSSGPGSTRCSMTSRSSTAASRRSSTTRAERPLERVLVARERSSTWASKPRAVTPRPQASSMSTPTYSRPRSDTGSASGPDEHPRSSTRPLRQTGASEQAVAVTVRAIDPELRGYCFTLASPNWIAQEPVDAAEGRLPVAVPGGDVAQRLRRQPLPQRRPTRAARAGRRGRRRCAGEQRVLLVAQDPVPPGLSNATTGHAAGHELQRQVRRVLGHA